MGAKRKLIGTFEFAGIAQTNDDGKVIVKGLKSVNKPIKHGIAKNTDLICHKRIEINEVEDNSVDGDTIYSKKICLKQKDLEGKPQSYREDSDEIDDEAEPKDVFTKGEKFLKNMVDNLWADARQSRYLIFLALALACIALGKAFGAI